MIVLFTDFGVDDPYVGQMKAVLTQLAGSIPVVDLLHRVPDFAVEPGAHLLAALAKHFPPGTLFLAVVDPGVGSDRPAVVVEADDYWYVGPDNGLLSVIAGRARCVRTWRILWRPSHLSPSFHGRDLFAPIAARIASSDSWLDLVADMTELEHRLPTADLLQVIFIDHYGNAITGVRAEALAGRPWLHIGNRRLPSARVFSEVPVGQAFWYVNSIGLVEVAINRGHAAALLGLEVGMPVRLLSE